MAFQFSFLMTAKSFKSSREYSQARSDYPIIAKDVKMFLSALARPKCYHRYIGKKRPVMKTGTNNKFRYFVTKRSSFTLM